MLATPVLRLYCLDCCLSDRKAQRTRLNDKRWSGKVIVPLRVLTVDVSSTFCVADQTLSRLYGSELGRRDSGVVCVTGQSLGIT